MPIQTLARFSKKALFNCAVLCIVAAMATAALIHAPTGLLLLSRS